MTAKQWLLRALAGLAFGFLWNAVVAFAWILVIGISHGSLDAFLHQTRHPPSTIVGACGFFATHPASFLGGLLAPLFLEASAGRGRLTASAALGATLGAFMGLSLGMAIGLVELTFARPSMSMIGLALVLGSLAGVAGGIAGGLFFRRPDQDFAEVAV